MPSSRKRVLSCASGAHSVSKKKPRAKTNTFSPPARRKRNTRDLCSKDLKQRDKLQFHKESCFHCVMCQKTLKTKIDYQVHLKEHGRKSAVQCGVCHQWYDSQRLLHIHSKVHLKREILKKNRITCKECPNSFVNQSRLVTHMKKFHSVFKCPDCEEYFTQMAGLRAHQNACHSLKWISEDTEIQSETDEKSITDEECVFCKEPLQSGNSLMSHMTLIHHGLKCPRCDIWCQGKGSLLSHFKKCKKNPRVKFFNCHLCRKHFEKADTLASHVKLCYTKVETENKARVIPETLSKDVVTSKQKKQPLKNRYGSLFQCEGCKKFFATRISWESHASTCLQKFKCSICSKTFPSSQGLSTHVRIYHTGEKPFECKQCGKRFPHSNLLKVHIAMVHQGNNANIVRGVNTFARKKAHKCLICRKVFPQASFLRMHMKIHTEEKPLMCGICLEKFSSEKAVIEHINIFHLADRDKQDTENIAYEVECVKTSSENWNKDHDRAAVMSSVQFSEEDQSDVSVAHACTEDSSVQSNSGKDTKREAEDVSAQSLGHTEVRQHSDINHANVVNPAQKVNVYEEAQAAGDLFPVLSTSVERQRTVACLHTEVDNSVYRIQQDTQLQNTPHTANSTGISDQSVLYTEDLKTNHIPQLNHAKLGVKNSQGEILDSSSSLQYGQNMGEGYGSHQIARVEAQREVTGDPNIIELVLKFETPEKQCERDKDGQGSGTAHLCHEGDDQDYYIIINNQSDEEEEEDVDHVQDYEEDMNLPCKASNQMDSSQINLQVKEEKLTSESENTETEFFYSSGSNRHGNLESVHHYESKENMKELNQRESARTLESNFEGGCNQRERSHTCCKYPSGGGNIQLICGICQQRFVTAGGLQQHKTSSHSLRCAQCGLEYMRMIDLVTHYESCSR